MLYYNVPCGDAKSIEFVFLKEGRRVDVPLSKCHVRPKIFYFSRE